VCGRVFLAIPMICRDDVKRINSISRRFDGRLALSIKHPVEPLPVPRPRRTFCIGVRIF
jgi:hypothetical protein